MNDGPCLDQLQGKKKEKKRKRLRPVDDWSNSKLGIVIIMINYGRGYKGLIKVWSDQKCDISG